MFDNKTVFVMLRDGHEEFIYKLEVDADTQQAINQIINASAEELVGKQLISFTGSYTPLEDETLMIENFQLSDDLKDAFRNPALVESFRPQNEDIPNVRAICIGYCESTAQGEKFTAAFQRLRKDQYISVDKLRLFFDRNTFKVDQRVGLSVGEDVDCVFVDEKLVFSSYYFARQIFDLSGYYRTANDIDIDKFISADVIDLGENAAQFKEKANSWVRRKIALINDSGVLTQFTAAQIKKLGKAAGIEIKTENKKIVFPEETEQMKILLSFLDEEAYQGPFSKDTILSTSKRRIGRQQ